MLNQIAIDYEDEEDPDARRWAQEHRRFLEENRPDVLRELQESGSLDSYLSSVGETASQRLEHTMAELLNDKEHQKLPYLERVRALQNRRQETEEGIRHDLILQPTRRRRGQDRGASGVRSNSDARLRPWWVRS